MAQFGEKLRKARENLGITQQTLADQIYVTRQTVSRWETGERFPDLLMLKKLSSLLNVTIDELLDDREMTDFVEKSPVVENPIVGNVMIALYACVVVVFVIQAFNALIMFHPLNELLGGYSFSFFLAGCYLVEAVLFIICFANLIRRTDTPKKTGILISFFFVLEMIPRIETIFNRTTGSATVLAIICLVPYLLGSYGGYSFFASKKQSKLGQMFIYFASGFEIFVIAMNIWTILAYSPSYFGLSMMVSYLLRILICVTFIYDVRVLNLRRKRANEVVELKVADEMERAVTGKKGNQL